MLDNDLEYFLNDIYTPLKTIENITDIIQWRADNEWDFLQPETREQGEELLCFNYAINQIVKHLLRMRQDCITPPQPSPAGRGSKRQIERQRAASVLREQR